MWASRWSAFRTVARLSATRRREMGAVLVAGVTAVGSTAWCLQEDSKLQKVEPTEKLLVSPLQGAMEQQRGESPSNLETTAIVTEEPQATKEESQEQQTDNGEENEGEGEEKVDEEENEGEEKVERPKWDYVPSEGDYCAVFLDEESKAYLRQRFPPLFPEEHYDHFTILFEPSKDQVLDQDDLLTEEYTLHIIGYAQDEHCQTVLVEAEHPHLKSKNKYGHITLSVRGGEMYAAKYSNVLLNRLAERPGAREAFRLLSNKPEQLTQWFGHLPEAGVYPASQASFENVEDEQLTVTGTYCLKSYWDGRKCAYLRENECSFCKFMKGGPCRVEFSRWEECVSKSKLDDEGEDDFIDRCASHTLVLKNCVDEHPEYYNILAGDDEGDDSTDDNSDIVDGADNSTSDDNEE